MTDEQHIDIDERSTWVSAFEACFVDLLDQVTWRYILAPGNFNSAWSRMAHLAKLAMNGDDPISALKLHLTEVLEKNFTHTFLYHACRVTDESSYLKYGLRPASIAELNEIAANLWGKSAALEAAIQEAAESGYSRHNQGKVGLWFSRAGAIEHGSGYLERGSEYLSGLANRVGKGAGEVLQLRGRPALVRCSIKLSEMDRAHLESLSTLPLLSELSSSPSDLEPIKFAPDHAIMHAHAIQPGQITIEYLD